MELNYIAILAASVAGWLWGAAYYGVFGKSWTLAQGLNPEDCKGQKMPLVPMVLAFIASLFMAFGLACLFRDLGVLDVMTAVGDGLAIGITFIVTTIAVNNAFQRRKPMLTIIDSVHWTGLLVLQSIILVLIS